MIAPHDATPIAEAFSWCTECPAAHADADDENTHHESTGHTATRRQADAFVSGYTVATPPRAASRTPEGR